MSLSDLNSHLGTQVCRNVIVAGRRTSIRMEQIYWQELQKISERERQPTNEIISMIDMRRGDTNLTAALRVFIICYMQENPAATCEDRATAEKTSLGGSDQPASPGRLRAGRIARALDVVGPPRTSVTG